MSFSVTPLRRNRAKHACGAKTSYGFNFPREIRFTPAAPGIGIKFLLADSSPGLFPGRGSVETDH